MFDAKLLKAKAVELGFNIVGVIPAEPAATLDAYFRWIEQGMHGSMNYMARPDRQARRQDLNVILPGVRSMVLVGVDYRLGQVPDALLNEPARGRVASYAWNLDYHDILTPRLEALAAWLHEQSGDHASGAKVYVDTGAVLERAHAHRAGLGFIGKNTMLIHPRRGSYFFLGEILTTLQFDHYDRPGRASMCGNCTRCLEACPTDAFPQPYVLDARRCISYLTIEHKGWIDRELRSLMGNWVFGCDVCQDVCPWQRFTVPTTEAAFHPVDDSRVAPPLLDLLALDEATFKTRYKGTPIERIKRRRLVRNAAIAAGNWGDAQAVPVLRHLLNDDEPLVRGHAAWALAQILGDSARPLLMERHAHEDDGEVRQELTANLSAMAS